MLIDFHTHAFPEKIAERAMLNLSFASGGLIPQHDGTVKGLKAEMSKDMVDISVVLGIATNSAQQTNVNNFAAETDKDERLIAFGSVHPEAPDVLEELERIKALGLKGVKLHPEYQNFFVDEERMKPIYKKISELGLITVFHAGQDYGYNEPFRCMPEALERALKWFDSPVIAAHWGGINCGDEVIKYLCGKEVYFDVSMGYAMMPKYYAQKIMELHTPDRMLFGTDTPWHTPDMEMRLLNTLELSEEDMNKITHKNAQKLLGI